MCEFFIFIDVVIVGSFLASYDHCYVLLNVADHFESRVLYVHTLLSFSSDQNSPLQVKSSKISLVGAESSGTGPDHHRNEVDRLELLEKVGCSCQRCGCQEMDLVDIMSF